MSRGPAATGPAEIAALRALTVGTIKSHLTRLIASGEIEVHLDLPGNRLEALKGDRKGQYSVRINDQWRICFEWPKGANAGITGIRGSDAESQRGHREDLCERR